jgi:microcompartment protein CcmK/EutM
MQVPDFDIGDRVATDAVGAELGGAVLIGGGDEAIGAPSIKIKL